MLETKPSKPLLCLWTQIKIPLKREEIDSTKQSYVKEEVIVKKKPVTETQNVTQEGTSENIKED